MRAKLLAVLLLAALAWCTLVPGTPVNNDPSPAAVRAGIHLAPPAPPHVGAVAIALAALALRILIRTVAVVPAVAVVSPMRRRPEADPVRRLVQRGGGSARRGPPPSVARA